MSDRLVKHYRELLSRYGDSAESAQYSSRESQERRFECLQRVGQLEGASLLDFGCGSAHLATHLKARGIRARYTGVDVIEEFHQLARSKHPEHRFGYLEDFAGERFDYVLISGVFNNRRKNNRRFYQDTVRSLFDVCDRGIAFNLMSTYVDYRDPGLFYEKPERAFSFIKQEITPFVVLRHDYEVKPDVIPFEFTVFAYRSAQP